MTRLKKVAEAESEKYTFPDTADFDTQFAWAEKYWPEEVEDFMKEWLLEKIDQAEEEDTKYTGPDIGLTADQLDEMDYKSVMTLYFSVANDADNENLINKISRIAQDYKNTINQ